MEELCDVPRVDSMSFKSNSPAGTEFSLSPRDRHEHLSWFSLSVKCHR